jgi:hypothetical protein
MPTNASPDVHRGAREQMRALLFLYVQPRMRECVLACSGLAAASAPADPVAGRRAGGRAAAPLVARTRGLHEYTRHTHARTFLRAALCVLPSQALACMSPRRHAITFTWTARRRPGALTLSQSSASVVPLQIISCRLPAWRCQSHVACQPSMPAQIRPSCRGQRRGP